MLILLWACSSPENEKNVEERLFSNCPIETAEEQLIDVGEVSLNVSCRGQGDTVVFLHGFPEFSYGWDKVMDELASEYRLIAPDQRGYNLSDKPSDISAYEIEYLVADAAALIQEISTEPVVLVAHDWGGPVGWLVAHQYPELLKGFLGANAPHPTIFAQLLESDTEQQEASEYMDWFRQDGVEDILAGNDYAGMISMFEGALSEEDIPRYKEAWAQEDAITGGLNWYRANIIDEQWVEPVTVEVPTIVMWGLSDTALLPQNIDGLEEYVPQLNIQTYPDVDHWINHRIPEEIASSVRTLLEENE